MQIDLPRRRKGTNRKGRGGEKDEGTGLFKECAQSIICPCMKMPQNAFVHYKIYLYFCLLYNLYSSEILMFKDNPTRLP